MKFKYIKLGNEYTADDVAEVMKDYTDQGIVVLCKYNGQVITNRGKSNLEMAEEIKRVDFGMTRKQFKDYNRRKEDEAREREWNQVMNNYKRETEIIEPLRRATCQGLSFVKDEDRDLWINMCESDMEDKFAKAIINSVKIMDKLENHESEQDIANTIEEIRFNTDPDDDLYLSWTNLIVERYSKNANLFKIVNNSIEEKNGLDLPKVYFKKDNSK